MFPLTQKSLENMFNMAEEKNAKYVAITVKMKGHEKEELIVNRIENAFSKLAYYAQTYDENLVHKFADGIEITDIDFAHDLEEFEGMI